MADLESFFGADTGGESIDPAAFERFKQRMQAAAAQLQAQQKQEQKQKQTEDELIKILMRFIHSGKRQDLLLLILALLERNVPASFILSILLISHQELQQEMKVFLLPAGTVAEQKPSEVMNGLTDENKQNLPDYPLGNEVLPLQVKIAITHWLKEIAQRVEEKSHRVINTAMEDGVLVSPVIQLAVFCLRDFLEQHKISCEYQQLKNFMTFMLNDIVARQAQKISDQQKLN